MGLFRKAESEREAIGAKPCGFIFFKNLSLSITVHEMAPTTTVHDWETDFERDLKCSFLYNTIEVVLVVFIL